MPPVFVANGDACGVCQGLDGTPTSSRPHDSCQCSIEDKGDDCTFDYTGGGSTHYGSGSYQATFGTELTVFCPDGSETGESLEIDLGDFDPGGGGDIFDFIADAIETAAAELCADCPEPEDPNVA